MKCVSVMLGQRFSRNVVIENRKLIQVSGWMDAPAEAQGVKGNQTHSVR